MTENKKIQIPSSFGGIVRYNEEYESRFKITPQQVIGFIVAIVILVIILKLFWPVSVN